MPDATTARLPSIALAALLLAGCASTPDGSAGPADPLEPVNRPIFKFNDALDRAVLRPVARGYHAVLPGPIERGIGNFFDNLGDVPVLFNTALQGKPRATGITASRLIVNTTIGLLGFIDVASAMGAEKQDEDFGQTLGYWGIGRGPYLVLPLFGPSSVRDGAGIFVDAQVDPVNYIDDDEAWLAAQTLRVVDRRAGLLGTGEVVDTASVDPYEFRRNAYLQRRVNQIYDGDPPPEALPAGGDEEEEGFDPFSDEDDDLFAD